MAGNLVSIMAVSQARCNYVQPETRKVPHIKLGTGVIGDRVCTECGLHADKKSFLKGYCPFCHNHVIKRGRPKLKKD